jgi:hypothetical protein
VVLSANVQLVLSANVQLVLSANVQVVLSANVQVVLSANVQLVHSANVQLEELERIAAASPTGDYTPARKTGAIRASQAAPRQWLAGIHCTERIQTSQR